MSEQSNIVLREAPEIASEVKLVGFEPTQTITMFAADGREAVVDFSGDEVTYSGNMPVAESARIFFEAVGYLLRGGA